MLGNIASRYGFAHFRAVILGPSGSSGLRFKCRDAAVLSKEWNDLNVHAEAGNVSKCEAIFKQLRGSVSSQKQTMLWNTLLKAYANAGDFAGAHRHHKEMRKCAIRENQQTFGKLIESAAKAGDVERATEWLVALEQNSRLDATDVHYNAVIDACAKGLRPDRAVFWLDRMINSTTSPTASSYNSVINSFAQLGKTDDAWQCLHKMQAASLTPTVVSYTSIIHSCAKRADTAAAVKFFGIMMQRSVLPNHLSYTAVMKAFANAGDIQYVKYWFEKLKDAGLRPNEVAYGIVIEAHARSGSLSDAVQWLEKMRSASIKPDVTAYNLILKGHSKIRNGTGASEWFKKMSQDSVKPDNMSYGTLAESFAMRSQVQPAIDLIGQMKSASVRPSVITYTSVLKACDRARPKRTQSAESMFRDAVKSRCALDAKILSVLDSVVGSSRRSELCKELRVDEEKVASAVLRKYIDRRAATATRQFREQSR
ncbi:unnamed protein product [Polarella glacialis]|uniref:PROP1-like PPR domain-containing protein n=1 Tax=Polarella glacialis TaxID=89957 RepID=A0A813FGG8_POLGL|nr:unnamed protein product [Polarella glacialis]